jgi:hypothetical protein
MAYGLDMHDHKPVPQQMCIGTQKDRERAAMPNRELKLLPYSPTHHAWLSCVWVCQFAAHVLQVTRHLQQVQRVWVEHSHQSLLRQPNLQQRQKQRRQQQGRRQHAHELGSPFVKLTLTVRQPWAVIMSRLRHDMCFTLLRQMSRVEPHVPGWTGCERGSKCCCWAHLDLFQDDPHQPLHLAGRHAAHCLTKHTHLQVDRGGVVEFRVVYKWFLRCVRETGSSRSNLGAVCA